MEDEQIIDLFFKRKESAIKALSDKYHRLCYNIIMKIVTDKRDIDECMNDSYLKIWNSIPPEYPKSLPAYLARIARNVALDRYSYNTAKMRNSDLTTAFAELEPYLCIQEYSIDNYINEETFKKFINQFLHKQSKDARVFFVRRYWYGDSIKEIALEYKVSEEKVKTSLFRTRNKLKSALLKEDIYL
jgi:RNA polymerase sigma-70 factor (ECF subfamily)